MNAIEQDIFLRKAKGMYVILIRDKKTSALRLVKDGALNRPYFNTNRKVAEDTARIITKQTGNSTAVHNLEDAFYILHKQNPKFEQDLIKQIQSL